MQLRSKYEIAIFFLFEVRKTRKSTSKKGKKKVEKDEETGQPTKK